MSDVTDKQVAANGYRLVTDHHPAWCSTEEEHCFITDDGVWVHGQAPVCWEDKTAAVRVETRLIDPGDDPSVWVELSVQDLRFKTSQYYGILPVAAVRRLRDQLTTHLDAAK